MLIKLHSEATTTPKVNPLGLCAHHARQDRRESPLAPLRHGLL